MARSPGKSVSKEQAYARRMLDTREKGFSYGSFLRRAWKGYLLLLVVFGFGIALLYALRLDSLCVFLMGVAVGALARDLGWVRNIRRTWPFSRKVTNWELVEQLAAGNDPAS